MTWDGMTQQILFLAGMFCGVEAGRLFYLDRPLGGGGFLLMAGVFLFCFPGLAERPGPRPLSRGRPRPPGPRAGGAHSARRA